MSEDLGNISKVIEQELLSLENPSKSNHLMKFFKTGKGEYGEGDKFLGITVPITRNIVKKYKHRISIKDIDYLINSEWHEIRLAGFLLLIEIYKKVSKEKIHKEIEDTVQYYINNLDKGNNWDLVDLIAPSILGDWLCTNIEKRKILDVLSEEQQGLWRQRVAIVSTFALIKEKRFDETFYIAKKYLTHKHDLIHKATGWMLRETGKRGGYDRLITFLNQYATVMPRTMLRYSIEKFPSDLRAHYLSLS